MSDYKFPGAISLASIDPLRRVRGYLNAKNPERRVLKSERDGVTVFHVPSEHVPGLVYDTFVDSNGTLVCTCVDFGENHKVCKHGFEVLDREFPELAPAVNPDLLFELLKTAPADKPWYADARRFPKAPYAYQEGPAESTRRDLAYMEEDDEVERLLIDLVGVIDRRFPHSGVGRPSLSPGEKVLAAVLRRHLKKSVRKFVRIGERLAERGILTFGPTKNTYLEYDKDVETLDYLKEAFKVAIAPYRLMETSVIIDSTGYSPFYVANWRLSNYGEKNIQPNTVWLKIHCVIGRISHAILGFVITPSRGEGTGDVTQVPVMLDWLKEQAFENLEYIIGDNTYLTADAWKIAKQRGITLIGAFKPKNVDADGLPRQAVTDAAKFAGENPLFYDEQLRLRNIIEGIFNAKKSRKPRLYAIGTKEEREARKHLLELATTEQDKAKRDSLLDQAAESALFVSRMTELYADVICQVLTTTVQQQRLRNRKIAYSKGSVFSHVREESDVA